MKKHSVRVLFPPIAKIETIEKHHGRIETRKLEVVDLLPLQVFLPHAKQAFSVERVFTDLNGIIKSTEKILGITSLSSKDVSPEKLLTLNRGHWVIENKLHYVRDVSMYEDSSRIRKGAGPRNMAIFRNMIISFFRIREIKNIAEKMLVFLLSKDKLFNFFGLRRKIKN